MKSVFQIIGIILISIIVLVGYTYAIVKFKSSKKEKCDEERLLDRLMTSAIIAICILFIFVAIPSLF